MPYYPRRIEYGEKYQDKRYEYVNVMLPLELYDKIPKNKLFNEDEVRMIGVTKMKGWENYAFFKPEPHILLFRRKLNKI